jgi:hypothetical protein
VEPSYLERLRHDKEFVLYRRRRLVQPGSPPVLLLAPTFTRPSLETLRKIGHEYSLRDELDSAWFGRWPSPSKAGGQCSCSKTRAAKPSINHFQCGWG